MTPKLPAAVELGRRGGLARTPAQVAARLANGRKATGRLSSYRLVMGELERLVSGQWVRLTPPYDRAARAYLFRRSR